MTRIYQVPGFQPATPPQPNLKELQRLRKIRAEREAEKKRTKLARKRDDYWQNHPPYFEHKAN